MKQTILATALALSLVAGTAFAHPTNATAENDQTWRGGSGMMMDQGTEMRGPGGQWHGMMGMHGMGRAGNPEQCLTGSRMYGPGMMRGNHWIMEPAQVEKRNAFFEATRELRKNMHDKWFEYMEASRNPKETIGGLRAKEQEISSLQQELFSKKKEYFTN